MAIRPPTADWEVRDWRSCKRHARAYGGAARVSQPPPQCADSGVAEKVLQPRVKATRTTGTRADMQHSPRRRFRRRAQRLTHSVAVDHDIAAAAMMLCCCDAYSLGRASAFQCEVEPPGERTAGHLCRSETVYACPAPASTLVANGDELVRLSMQTIQMPAAMRHRESVLRWLRCPRLSRNRYATRIRHG